MTRCKQCHMDGHHKMSCTDEANPARKDRVTIHGTLKEPIVEGAYYERYCGRIIGPMTPALMGVYAALPATELTRRVWITPTDPAEIVAELRAKGNQLIDDSEIEYDDHVLVDSDAGDAFLTAADLVAKKLGVES